MIKEKVLQKYISILDCNIKAIQDHKAMGLQQLVLDNLPSISVEKTL